MTRTGRLSEGERIWWNLKNFGMGSDSSFGDLDSLDLCKQDITRDGEMPLYTQAFVMAAVCIHEMMDMTDIYCFISH